jgi:hypothetical protein
LLIRQVGQEVAERLRQGQTNGKVVDDLHLFQPTPHHLLPGMRSLEKIRRVLIGHALDVGFDRLGIKRGTIVEFHPLL